MDELLSYLLREARAIVHIDGFLSDLPWEAQAFVYLLSALVVALLFLAIPNRWLEWIGTRTFMWRGKKRYPFSANMISAYRVPITLAGAYLYYSGINHYWGFIIIVVGLVLDRMDGKMADILEAFKKLKGDLTIPGKTKYGKVIDPAADKSCLVPMIWLEVLDGFLGWLRVAIMTGFELLGTVVRPPFINRKWRNRKYRWLVVKLRRRLRDPKATGFGKAKMFMQCVIIFLNLPNHLRWWDGSHSWLNQVMSVVTSLAGLSVVFRFKYHKYIDGIITPLDEFFSHLPGNGKNDKNGTGNGKG